MKLPTNVPEKMKRLLGIDGVTHRVSGINIWVDTDCLEWKLPPFNLEPPKLDQSLTEVFEKISRQISGENFDTKSGYMNIKKYQTRIMEAFEQIKTPELQKELD